MKRSEFIPGAIEAGCDLILYYRDKDEDIQFMHDGIKNGLVSMERIDEAVTRVLALKLCSSSTSSKRRNAATPKRRHKLCRQS